MTELYNLPRNSKFKVEGTPQTFRLHNIDGMYSYCTGMDDKAVYHFQAWTEVTEVTTDEGK